MEISFSKLRHSHSLILKENFHAHQEGHNLICCYCDKPILCNSSVYTCTNNTKHSVCAFILHKDCELPMKHIHPRHEHVLDLVSTPRSCEFCYACLKLKSNAYGCKQGCVFRICLKCAVPLKENGPGLGLIQHWSHQHALRLLDRYATFECDGCNKVASDFSYLCDICSFWIHKGCASLPQFGLFQLHHKHPLRLSGSLPQVYHKFPQFCRICRSEMDPRRWLYYCANCRFFAHIHCALSKTGILRHQDDDPKIIHLPAPDEQLMNSMIQKWIKDMIYRSIYIAPTPAYHIRHWAHEHQLQVKNKSSLITANYTDLSPESERLITCMGCTKPISTSSDDADVFYECFRCNYSLHRYCALFPQKISHPSFGLLEGFHGNVFLCNGCHIYSYGFRMDQTYRNSVLSLDVCCACLPQKIKHQAHDHPLQLNEMELPLSYDKVCKACGCLIKCEPQPIFFECVSCKFSYAREHDT